MINNRNSIKKDITDHIMQKYKASPEFLWVKYPEYAVFRHDDNRKWFGVIMSIPYEKIDSSKTGMVDILNVKVSDLLLRDMLMQNDGYYAGYHMNHRYWLSAVLDGSVPKKEIFDLINISYMATASKDKKHKLRPPKEWLIPSNPKYYDIVSAFDSTDTIEWKQGKGIKKDDIVFMYVGTPVSAVLYKCIVIETDIPYNYDSERLNIKNLMRIKLLKRYEPDSFTLNRLRDEFNVYSVRGPRSVPEILSRALN